MNTTKPILVVNEQFILCDRNLDDGTYNVLFRMWNTPIRMSREKLVEGCGEERARKAEKRLNQMLDEANNPMYSFLEKTGEVWCPESRVFVSVAGRKDAPNMVDTHQYRLAYRQPFATEAAVDEQWFTGHDLNEGIFDHSQHPALAELLRMTNESPTEHWPMMTDLLDLHDRENPPARNRERWTFRDAEWTSPQKTELLVRFRNYHDNHTDELPYSAALWEALRKDNALPSDKKLPRGTSKRSLPRKAPRMSVDHRTQKRARISVQ